MSAKSFCARPLFLHVPFEEFDRIRLARRKGAVLVVGDDDRQHLQAIALGLGEFSGGEQGIDLGERGLVVAGVMDGADVVHVRSPVVRFLNRLGVDAIVLRMGADEPHVDRLPAVQDHDDEPILVAAEIEDHPVARQEIDAASPTAPVPNTATLCLASTPQCSVSDTDHSGFANCT